MNSSKDSEVYMISTDMTVRVGPETHINLDCYLYNAFLFGQLLRIERF